MAEPMQDTEQVGAATPKVEGNVFGAQPSLAEAATSSGAMDAAAAEATSP
jgi:hypothetical protein